MTVVRKPLDIVESDTAIAAGERRSGVRFAVTGRVIFMGAREPRTYANRQGGQTTVLPFTVFAGDRAATVSCEVSTPEGIGLVLNLVEGEPVEIAGQLVSDRGRFGLWTRVRVFSIDRAHLRPDSAPLAASA